MNGFGAFPDNPGNVLGRARRREAAERNRLTVLNMFRRLGGRAVSDGSSFWYKKLYFPQQFDFVGGQRRPVSSFVPQQQTTAFIHAGKKSLPRPGVQFHHHAGRAAPTLVKARLQRGKSAGGQRFHLLAQMIQNGGGQLRQCGRRI